MPLSRLSSHLLAVIFFACGLSALADGPGEKPSQVKFRVRAEFMIIVPVTINGSGPYDFLLDTGSTNTTIDQKLAKGLNLPLAGNIKLITPRGSALIPSVRADSLSMAGATVSGLKLSAVNHYVDHSPWVRGSLGEDFLRNFDLLIDNRRHLIQFETALGPLADGLDGEHLPFLRNGLDHGELTRNRLIVVGHIGGSRDKDLTLQLDSGTQVFQLFVKSLQSTVFSEQSYYSVSDMFGRTFTADAQTVPGLRLGKAFLSKLTVLSPGVSIPGMDVDGVLPISLFHSIFISHSGGFVILNPSVKAPSLKDPSAKPALAQVASQPPPDSRISPQMPPE